MQPIHSKNHLSSRVIKTEPIHWRNLQFIQAESFKDLSPAAHEKLKHSMVKNQFVQPFYVWEDPKSGVQYCLDGKHRTIILEELIREGVEVPDVLPATFFECASKKQAAELVLIYSSVYAKATEQGFIDFAQLYNLDIEELKLSIDLPSLEIPDIPGLQTQPEQAAGNMSTGANPSLQERFLIPPFSVFDTRQGYWQERKRQWHGLGINSQASREDVELVAKSGQPPAIYSLRNEMREQLGREPTWDEVLIEAKAKGLHVYEGASIFDPVIAEVLYSWFCPPAGSVLDPFAGGSVRGIVAGALGLTYVGIDLRAEQVHANVQQWEEVKKLNDYNSTVVWLIGDSKEVLCFSNEKHDFVFSCPPYHDLEKYSDDPADLSNMDYAAFRETYAEIIRKSVARLKENRFACFVVSEIRDKSGAFKGFVDDTIKAFENAGCMYYNEIILLNVAGSLPIRVGRQFQGYRKVGRTHQNILVFYKGDPKQIPQQFPEIEVQDIDQLETPLGTILL